MPAQLQERIAVIYFQTQLPLCQCPECHIHENQQSGAGFNRSGGWGAAAGRRTVMLADTVHRPAG
jgi:hypothetical protein